MIVEGSGGKIKLFWDEVEGVQKPREKATLEEAPPHAERLPAGERDRRDVELILRLARGRHARARGSASAASVAFAQGSSSTGDGA